MATDLELRLWKWVDRLWAARSSVFDPQWQYLSQYFWPDVSDINTQKTESTTDWFQQIYDSSPMRASATCSVGVRNWVTPSTDPWLGLSPPSNLARRSGPPLSPRMARLNPNNIQPDDNGQDEATRWLSYSAEEISQALSSCNFYSAIQPFNRSACVFGTALLLCEEGKDNTFRFEQYKVGTFVIAENDQRIVDKVGRKFKLTVRQAVSKFGEESLPGKIQKAYQANKFDDQFTFIHHVMPMDEYRKMGGEVANELGASQMAFASIYQEDSSKQIVQEGGYEEMPYFCLRWSRWGTDNQVWGCSPAFETLPDARQINFVTQYQDALAELKAFPRILVPDSQTGDVELAAGGATPVRGDDMARGVQPKEWLTGAESGEVIAMLERKQKAIEDAFFCDVFKALGMLQDKKMTATEVAQRVGEKLDQFTGTFDQYITEVINPLVRRCLGIMVRSGHLMEPPQSLMAPPASDPKGQPQLAVPKVVINSRVTLAIKAIRNTGVQNTIQTLMPLVQSRPELLDNFDLDTLTRETGRNFGIPEKMFNSMKKVIELRDARAKMIQEQRSLEAAQGVAKAGKDLGKAPPQLQQAALQSLPAQQAA